jgi:membrane associated rhomboid family serine protease
VAPGNWLYFSVDKAVKHLELWRWVTYQFVDADIFRMAFNMLGLYFFGPLMEQWWGRRRYLAFYLLCGMSGAILFSLFSLMPGTIFNPQGGALLGSSGSIFGILVGCAVLFPKMPVMLLIPPIPMTMRTMALVFLGIAVASVLLLSGDAGGQAAHLSGAALGFLLVRQPWLLGFADHMSLGFVRRMRQGVRRKRGEMRIRKTEDEQAEVDRILEKVRAHGLHSLSRGEKRCLHRATERQRQSG